MAFNLITEPWGIKMEKFLIKSINLPKYVKRLIEVDAENFLEKTLPLSKKFDEDPKCAIKINDSPYEILGGSLNTKP